MAEEKLVQETLKAMTTQKKLALKTPMGANKNSDME
jgi:hypothetical protein